MLSNLQALIDQTQRILLLQGPIGAFFHQFADYLGRQHHKQVFKINFNGGDALFYPNDGQQAMAYTGSVDEFDAFLASFVAQHAIDSMVCFGDTRIYHRKAKALCQQQGLGFWVFEEGYFRPHYITLERDGVNDYSPEPRDSAALLSIYPSLGEPMPPKEVAPGFWPMAWQAMRYYRAMAAKRVVYPHYRHHRSSNVYWYIQAWCKSALIKRRARRTECEWVRRIEAGQMPPFFVLPLQVHMDSQVKVHSDFKSVASFLRRVLRSFAVDAPADTCLVIKHHPMDRGFIDYRHFLDKLGRHYDINQRIVYVYDIPLPVLMRHARGMVVINSTSGLSAMIHRLPVKVLGRSNYDMLRLTDQQPLDGFWQQPMPPEPAVFNAFRLYHLHKTQINGSFYGKTYFK